MWRYLLVATVALILYGCSANKFDKPRKEIPGLPGTIWLKDSLFMDKLEISNRSYMEYLTWLANNDAGKYKKALPDSSVWMTMTFGEEYTKFYLRHPGYSQYPVVGVSWRQAKTYCAWRTERVKEYLQFKKKKKGEKIPQDFEYRLPTDEEWKYAAQAGIDCLQYKHGFEKLIDKKGLPKIHTSEKISFESGAPTTDLPTLVTFGKPNKFGFYNMTGNVAEMVKKPMLARGGSWTHTLKESEIDYELKYSSPTNWLGFRCICQINDTIVQTDTTSTN
jgi:formylglycine-generating enzyme required for sulfatase activity